MFRGGIPKGYPHLMTSQNVSECINIYFFQVKTHVWVFVNCLIENPTFDSQTKENMTKQAKGFGSKAPLTEQFVNKV